MKRKREISSVFEKGLDSAYLMMFPFAFSQAIGEILVEFAGIISGSDGDLESRS